MAILDPFTSFDLTPYQSCPQLPLQTLVVLANALDTRRPDPAPAYVHQGADNMRAAAKQAGQAMVMRLRESNRNILTTDLDLDNAMDALFTLLRDELRRYRMYQRPGLDFLLQDADWQARLQALRQHAQTAAALLIKLFGDGKLGMLKRDFPAQSQLMTSVLSLIDEDQLEPDLLAVTGPDLLPLIRRVNAEYQQMVVRRANRANAAKVDLKAIRHKLQRRIVNYATVVLTLLDEDQPQTRAIVEAALRPMVTMRIARNSSAAAGGESEQDADLIVDPEANLQTVLAQAQAELEQEG